MSNVSLRGRLSRHLAVAATVAAGAAGAASGQIVYWGDANLVVPATIDGLYINVETQQTGSSGGSVAGWDINPYSATGLTFFTPVGGGVFRLPGALTPSSVALGTVIDSSGTFGGGSASTSSPVGAWTLNASNYFGFRFVASDGGTKYAWARFVIGPALNDGTRVLAEIAYESSGGAITVGAIPAPGAVALLGLAGLAGSRRRRG